MATPISDKNPASLHFLSSLKNLSWSFGVSMLNWNLLGILPCSNQWFNRLKCASTHSYFLTFSGDREAISSSLLTSVTKILSPCLMKKSGLNSPRLGLLPFFQAYSSE